MHRTDFLLELTNFAIFGIRPMARSLDGGSSLLEKRLLPLAEEGWADLLRGADLADGNASPEEAAALTPARIAAEHAVKIDEAYEDAA